MRVTSHTSHVTRHTSHVTRHSSLTPLSHLFRLSLASNPPPKPRPPSPRCARCSSSTSTICSPAASLLLLLMLHLSMHLSCVVLDTRSRRMFSCRLTAGLRPKGDCYNFALNIRKVAIVTLLHRSSAHRSKTVTLQRRRVVTLEARQPPLLVIETKEKQATGGQGVCVCLRVCVCVCAFAHAPASRDAQPKEWS